jgi:hypothetical protein
VNKLGEKILFLVMILQALFCGGIYMYSRMEKWNLREKYTVFIYPFIVFMLIGCVLVSFVVSIWYFAYKMVHTGKICFCLPVLLLAGIVAFSIIHFSELNLRAKNFTQYQKERNEIVRLIMEGKLVPDERGNIPLPAELLNEEMARGGCVWIVSYQGETGIFFCTFTGLMEDTAGYVYLTNDIKYGVNHPLQVILQGQYADRWYFCGTYYD